MVGFALSLVSECAANFTMARHCYRTCSIYGLIRADVLFDSAKFEFLDIFHSQFIPELLGRPKLCLICKISGSICADPRLRLVCTIRGRIQAQFGANPHPPVSPVTGVHNPASDPGSSPALNMAEESSQFTAFNQCLARRFLSQPGIADSDPADTPGTSSLDDFATYLASEAWPALPSSVRSATHEMRRDIPEVDSLDLESIPTAFVDTLVSCGIADDTDDAIAFMRKVLAEYIDEVTAAPPVWSKTRTSECEICEREVPVTYHHLIPREVHAKALKKKWHPESMLNSVAWLCRCASLIVCLLYPPSPVVYVPWYTRPCHSTVHRVTSNEELAQEYYTVDRLLEREDVQKWRKYISKQRWSVKRG